MSKGKQEKKIDSWSEVGLGEETENNNPVDNNVDRDIAINKPINSNNEVDDKDNSEISIEHAIENGKENHMFVAIDKAIDEALAIKKEKDKPVFHGVYFEPDVSAAINKIAKKGGKGVKSKLINDIVKAALQQKGLL